MLSRLCLAKIETELYRRIKWLRHRCVPGLSSITVTAVPDQTSDRSATPSVRGPRITRFKQPQQLLCNSRVAVVQATDTWVRNYRAAAHARLSSTQRLFLVERNHVVVQLTAAASHPSLRYSVLPGACHRTSQWRNAHCANRAGPSSPYLAS